MEAKGSMDSQCHGGDDRPTPVPGTGRPRPGMGHSESPAAAPTPRPGSVGLAERMQGMMEAWGAMTGRGLWGMGREEKSSIIRNEAVPESAVVKEESGEEVVPVGSVFLTPC